MFKDQTFVYIVYIFLGQDDLPDTLAIAIYTENLISKFLMIVVLKYKIKKAQFFFLICKEL